MEEWMMEEGKCDWSAWKVESWSARVNRVRPSKEARTHRRQSKMAAQSRSALYPRYTHGRARTVDESEPRLQGEECMVQAKSTEQSTKPIQGFNPLCVGANLRTLHTASSKCRRRSIEKWRAGEGGAAAEGAKFESVAEGSEVVAVVDGRPEVGAESEKAEVAEKGAEVEKGAEAEKQTGLGVCGLEASCLAAEDGEETSCLADEGRLRFSVSRPLAACTCDACRAWKESQALAWRARTCHMRVQGAGYRWEAKHGAQGGECTRRCTMTIVHCMRHRAAASRVRRSWNCVRLCRAPRP